MEFIATNTDSQALGQSLQVVGYSLNTVTQGLGAGSRPDVGKAAAEAIEELLWNLKTVIWFSLPPEWAAAPVRGRSCNCPLLVSEGYLR